MSAALSALSNDHKQNDLVNVDDGGEEERVPPPMDAPGDAGISHAATAADGAVAHAVDGDAERVAQNADVYDVRAVHSLAHDGRRRG